MAKVVVHILVLGFCCVLEAPHSLDVEFELIN